MRRPGWRTGWSYHVRALSRRIRVAWFGLLDRFDAWRERNVLAEDPYDRQLNYPVCAVPWVGPLRPFYPGRARADIWVSDGDVRDMVQTYLMMLEYRAPREVRTWA